MHFHLHLGKLSFSTVHCFSHHGIIIQGAVGFLRECIPGVWWGLGSPPRFLVGEKRKRREKDSEKISGS